MSTEVYGPVNCNVAIALSERQPISTEPCERCGTTTPSKGCLFYEWRAPGDWRTYPQFQRDSETHAVWGSPEHMAKLASDPELAPVLRNKIEAVRLAKAADLTKLTAEDMAARATAQLDALTKACIEAPTVGTKLSRVKRAKLIDYLEEVTEKEHTEEDLNNIADHILRIINND